MLFSTRPRATPPSCRASSRSAISTRTRSRLPKPPPGTSPAEALALPPALGALERRLLLTRLITQWAQSPELHGASGTPLIAQTPAAACTLADDLARLIDDMTTRGVSWDRLDDLVPDEFDEYWQLTLQFLQIARQRWPAILEDQIASRPIKRRDALIKAEAARLARKTDAPGDRRRFDRFDSIDCRAHRHHRAAAAWRRGAAGARHRSRRRIVAADRRRREKEHRAGARPSAIRHAGLLARIGVGRDAVVTLANRAGASGWSRKRFVPPPRPICGAPRPPIADFEAHTDAALGTMAMIEAANPEEEALAIAVALREAVHDGKTAALVTPDRALGRRVLAALRRWNITAEDSGGDALADTPAGIFARLAAATALDGTPPVTLLALLKHPLLRLGEHKSRRHARARDPARPAAARRQRRPRPGADEFSRSARQISPQGAGRSASFRSAHRSRPTANLPPPPISLRGSARRWRRSKVWEGKRIRSANWPSAIAT